MNLHLVFIYCPGVQLAVCEFEVESAGKPLSSRLCVPNVLFGSCPVTSGVMQHLQFQPGVTKQIKLLHGINLCLFSGMSDKAGMQQAELDASLIGKYSSLFNYMIHVLIKQQI